MEKPKEAKHVLGRLLPGIIKFRKVCIEIPDMRKVFVGITEADERLSFLLFALMDYPPLPKPVLIYSGDLSCATCTSAPHLKGTISSGAGLKVPWRGILCSSNPGCHNLEQFLDF